MQEFPEGRAIVYCEGAFMTPNGKTAHGLVRRTRRYEVLSVVDSACAGRDAGEALDGKTRGIPVFASLAEAIEAAEEAGDPATHLVIGLAPDGGRLPAQARKDVMEAIHANLNIDSGLHDFLSEDPTIAPLAQRHGVRIRDVRKPPDRDKLHFFTGKIAEVDSIRVAVLGTDSAVGKRTTSWILIDALEKAGYKAELVGTGQTAWMQGVRYGVIFDSMINDFVTGEIEHAVWSAWNERRPDVIVVEGQGSLLNPAYPGGHELLASSRPQAVVMQHPPARTAYDGFPEFPLHSIQRNIQAVEVLSDAKVVAVTINHEELKPDQIDAACARIAKETGLPAIDVLRDGADALVELIMALR